jgi:hypothetical protein
MFRHAAPLSLRFVSKRSYATVTKNAPLAEKLKINGDRLWYDSVAMKKTGIGQKLND